MKKIFTLLFLTLIASVSAMAQGKIEKYVNPLRNSDSVIYSEKRDPRTKEVINESLYIENIGEKLAKKIIEAMQSERGNSISYSIYTSGNSPYYMISFENPNYTVTEYSIYGHNKTKWALSVETRQAKNRKKK